MSETQTIAPPAAQGRVPTVYFIDDSATMREVIKIAFRKENVHIIACADAASALDQFASAAPDAVITDVIMPDKDGYQVCEFVKQHAQFAQTPVLLMSGVVNRDVAEKAMAVKADDLIRKPFQPQDLVARVKAMLAFKFPPAAVRKQPEGTAESEAFNPRANADERKSVQPLKSPQPDSRNVLTDFFNPGLAANSPDAGARPGASSGPPSAWSDRPALAASPVAVSAPHHPGTPASNSPSSPVGVSSRSASPATQPPPRVSPQASPTSGQQAAGPSSAEVQRLRSEVVRLELLVKKLQAELAAEHQYCAALESHLKSLQE